MSNYEINKHKKCDKIKWIATFLAVIILAGACATTLAMGIKNNGWFAKEDIEENQEMPDDDETNELVITPIETANAMRLAVTPLTASLDDGVSTVDSSELANSYTINATLTPENATLRDLTWSMSMSGYTPENYISLSATTGSMINVTCIKAFPVQITLTCTWDYDTSISASCTLDYLQRLENFSVTSTSTGTSADLMISSATSSYGVTSSNEGLVNFTPNFTYSTGTVKGTLTLNSVTFTVDKYFMDCIGFTSYYQTVASSVSVSSGSVSVNSDITPILTDFGYLFSYKDFFAFSGTPEASFATNSNAIAAAKAAVANAAMKYDGEGYITVDYIYAYGEVEMTYTGVIEISTINYSLIATDVTGISLNNTCLLF